MISLLNKSFDDSLYQSSIAYSGGYLNSFMYDEAENILWDDYNSPHSAKYYTSIGQNVYIDWVAKELY